LTQTIKAWSFNRLLQFEACPHRSFLDIIQKAPTPDYDATHPMVRGRMIHTEVEEYITGKTDKFPSTGKKLKALLTECQTMIQKGQGTAEEQWAFTENWDRVGWYDETVWVRMATDVFLSYSDDAAAIIDWKTGKSFGNEVKYMQQMQLYAVGAFMLYPKLEYIDVTLGFLDDGKERTKPFERGDKINKLLLRFTERARKMTTAVDFRLKPSAMNCKYCPFGPTGTKACIYGVEPL